MPLRIEPLRLLAQAASEASATQLLVMLAVLVVVLGLIVVLLRAQRRRRRGQAEAPARERDVEADLPTEAARDDEFADGPGVSAVPAEPEPARAKAPPGGGGEAARSAAAPGAEPAAAAAPAAETPAFLVLPPATMRDGLARTKKEGFVARLGGVFRGKQIDDQLLDRVDEVLLTSDIGVRTAQKLIDGMRAALTRKALSDADAVWQYLRVRSEEILAGVAVKASESPIDLSAGPEVMVMVGVNGTGKTTTIGKLAARYAAAGRKVLLAAGDTFRAAAVEQLAVWARRVNVAIHQGADEADPASVVFDAINHARAEGYDLVIVDTAGRLHTKVNLMEELKKVTRVIGKARAGAPHHVYLVLDATTGQNAIQQASIFKDAVHLTGIVLTKLDGTARGGVVLGICDELGIPIRFVGVGERLQDLRPFDAREFIDALFAEN